MGHEEIISAQVVLRAADGREAAPDAAITAETLASFLPSDEAARRARRFFTEAGFTVGLLVGISFSIAGTAATFRSLFKTELQREDGGGIRAANKADDSSRYHLPLDSLPEDVKKAVSAVTFTPPPDFGPGNFM